MSETPLPCPLCGGGWHWFSNWSAPSGQRVYARCNGVDCNCEVYGSSQQQVIDRINRRVPGPETAKMVANLREYRKAPDFAGCSSVAVWMTGEEAAALLKEQGAAGSAIRGKAVGLDKTELDENESAEMRELEAGRGSPIARRVKPAQSEQSS